MSTKKEQAEHEVTYTGFRSAGGNNYFLAFDTSSEEFWGLYYESSSNERPYLELHVKELEIEFLDEGKGKLARFELAEGRRVAVEIVDKCGDIAANTAAASFWFAIGSAGVGLFYPPAWAWTVKSLYTMGASVVAYCATEVLIHILQKTRYVRFSCVSKDLAKVRWKDVGKVRFTGRMPKKHYEEMLGEGKFTKEQKAAFEERAVSA